MIWKAERGNIDEMCIVINDGASAYKGVIPDDRWHEPYMSPAELDAEIAAGVQFSCYMKAGQILGVMGIQDKGSVVLIRHAYVRTAARRQGIGAKLLNDLVLKTEKPVLIGTWSAARWAIDFYQKYEFSVVPERQTQDLLRKYWNVPARQMETSVVLADQRYLAQIGNAVRQPGTP